MLSARGPFGSAAEGAGTEGLSVDLEDSSCCSGGGDEAGMDEGMAGVSRLDTCEDSGEEADSGVLGWGGALEGTS